MQKYPLIKCILLFPFMFILLLGCVDNTAVIKTKTAIQTPVPTPDYIFQVSPIRTSNDEYHKSLSSKFTIARGIVVSIIVSRMDVDEESWNWENIKQRVILIIDGKNISNETLQGGEDGEQGAGLFRLSWAPSLSTGLHEAKFRFITDSGEILEYNWQFVIE